MDPDRENHPVLYYVMKKIGRISTVDSASPEIDLEQPPSSPTSAKDEDLVYQMPHLNRPKVLASMASAISDVAYTRSVLQTLGPPPDHESVDAARAAIAGIESRLCKQLEEIVLSQMPDDVDQTEWREQLAKREEGCRRAAEEEMSPYKAVVQLDEMHESYEKLLENAEERLVKIYGSAEETAPDESLADEEAVANEEVVRILQQPSEGLERVDLDGRRLRFLPEAFGQLYGLVALNLSSNLLEVIPDSIAGLENLRELNLSGNLLVSLPDSIGLLLNLKILDVSGNKITVLPDSICKCRSLVELDASYNKLTYLPTNIGSELVYLQKLLVHLNKIRSLPTSIGEMRSLRHLDAHFNELCCLPQTIGGLIELEILNLSSNFSDLRELPDTFGDLINLKELDLSNNQIHYLPSTFGRLDKLTKLNLEHNPLVIPPMEIQTRGVEAVKAYMRKMWVDILVAEEGKSPVSGDQRSETSWLTRSSSWLNNWVVGVSGYLGTGERSPRDPYLDQQL